MMKREIMFCPAILVVCLLFISCNQATKSQITNESKFPELRGPYLGQTPPGDVPELFAPGVVPDAGSEHTATMFTADGKEVFWGRIMNPRQSPRCHVIMHMKQENGTWGKPELAPFNIGINNFIDSVSPDGKRVYFQAKHPFKKDEKSRPKFANWVVHKTNTGWGKPILLEKYFQWEEKYFDFYDTNSGNRYFTSTLKGAGRNIGFFRQKYINGKHAKPLPIGKTINSKYLDYAFYVDPDEKFIIFSSNRPGGFSPRDIYISYQQSDESWGPAINLGAKINSTFPGGVDWPYLSPDGKYLFFISSINAYQDSDVEEGTYEQLKAISSRDENGYNKVYWVNTSFIEALRPEK